jgi:hypothetical protein
MEIKFSEIDTAFSFVSFGEQYEHYAYLNQKTGKIYYVSELGDSDEDIPEDIYENEDYIEIPHKDDLNLGRNLVFSFVGSRLPEDLDKVQNYFRKKGAYSRFKDLLERKELLDEWHQFENDQIEKELRNWCKINKIKIAG